MHADISFALNRGLQKTNILSILEISRTRIIATCGCCGNQNFLIPDFKSMKPQPNVPCQGDCCHIKENGAICGWHKHVGKGGFCQNRDLAAVFYLESSGVWQLDGGTGFVQRQSCLTPNFLSWKEGEEPGPARWRSRTLQKSRTNAEDPQPPLGAHPGAAQTQGSRAQWCFQASEATWDQEILYLLFHCKKGTRIKRLPAQ